MLYNIIIAPIETIVDWVFNFFTVKFSRFGIIGAVCGVSLAINFLALPLYNIADTLQEKERKISKKLEPRVKRIKKAFKGNERFMMLSTYYRQNDYNPIYTLRSSLSILIEIPFFIAAYHFLSNNEALHGSSFWIFNDLGSPDGILTIGGFSINILPIIMTLINFVSGAIYTKEAPLKEKVQLYLVAGVFLVLLYDSPSGLVIYWILNNLFSLAKNIVMKMKNPGKVLHIIISFLLISAALFMMTISGLLWKKLAFLFFALLVTFLPLAKPLLNKSHVVKKEENSRLYFPILLFSGLGSAILTGLLLPSSVIATSPAEFSFLGNTESPLSYVYNSFFIFAGFFVFWPCVIYKLFGKRVKKIESIILLYVFLFALVNSYVLKSDYSNLNALFILDSVNSIVAGTRLNILTMCSILLIVTIVFIAFRTKVSRFIPALLIALCLAEFSLGIVKVTSIKESFEIISKAQAQNHKTTSVQTEYNLSKTKQNVVVLFLDRAINSFIPQIFSEYPEIQNQFEGFIYYPNTLSYSNATIEGVTPIFGGYEYTQERMNERSSELLLEKHNEAILVMPKLFADAGFEVTVTDPSWAGYVYVTDLDFMNRYDRIKASYTGGKNISAFTSEKALYGIDVDEDVKRACVDFTVIQCLPPVLRYTFYYTARRSISSQSQGLSFFQNLANLYYLPEMTDFSSECDTFTFISNDATHEVYVNLADDFESLAEEQTDDITFKHYQANIAALKQVGKWFDYLRQNDVYDNTRIIIVSDHGRNIASSFANDEIIQYSALFMVKDFNSTGEVKTDSTFMTNADTLFVAKENLPVSNINPLTGYELKQEKDEGINIYASLYWNAEEHQKDYTFELDDNQAWHVSNDIYDDANWIPLTEWKQMNGGKE